MLPDRVSNPGPLTYESGALPIALRGPAANSADPDVTPHHTASHQGLHCLLKRRSIYGKLVKKKNQSETPKMKN